MTGELDRERSGIRIFFNSNPIFLEFFQLYTIEEHASPQNIEKAFLDEVKESDILILLLDKQLRTAVKKEFFKAAESTTKIFIYIRNTESREQELAEFIGQHAYKYHCGAFYEPEDLCLKIKTDLCSDLTRNYYRTTFSETSTEHAIITHRNTEKNNNLRFYNLETIAKMSADDNFKNLDNDQIISLAALQIDETGNLKNSLLLYELVLYRDPNNWMAYNNRGLVLYEMGMLHESYFSYRKSLELNPISDSTLYNLGLHYERCGYFDRAIEHFEKSLSINKDKESALEHLLNCYIQTKNYEKAIQYGEKAFLINQSETNIYNLCTALALSGNIDEALSKSFLMKNSQLYLFLRAMIFYSSRNWETCLQEIDNYIETNEFNYDIAIKKINCLIYLERIDDACTLIKHIDEHYFLYPSEYNNLGFKLYEKNVELNFAKLLISKAVEIDPFLLPAWKNIQCILGSLKNHEEGIIISDTALKYFPDDIDLVLNKSRFLFYSGNFNTAVNFSLKEISRIFRYNISQPEIDEYVSQVSKKFSAQNIELLIQDMLNLKK